jgi:preprotein translocase subunit YajC
MLQHLQPGAHIRTTAQIMGTIVEVGDDWAIVETTPGTRIKFGKAAIVGIIMDDEAEAEAAETGEPAEDAPTPGGIGDAPHGASDSEPHAVSDAVPAAQDAVPAPAEPADTSEEEVKDAEPAKS